MVKREMTFYNNRKRISIFDVSVETVDMLMEITDQMVDDFKSIEMLNLNNYTLTKNTYTISKMINKPRKFVFFIHLN